MMDELTMTTTTEAEAERRRLELKPRPDYFYMKIKLGIESFFFPNVKTAINLQGQKQELSRAGQEQGKCRGRNRRAGARAG